MTNPEDYLQEIIEDEDFFSDILKTDPKDVKDFKSNFCIEKCHESTYVIVLAVHKSSDANDIERVPCARGIPIGGYVFDRVNECYVVNCVSYLSLGYVKATFQLSLKANPSWSIEMPMPETVLRRYMTSQQKNDLKRFKSCYSGDDYRFEFIQMVSHF